MELSHRSPAFDKIIVDAETDLRSLLRINNDYAVLFMQGGATSQFSAVPMNLYRRKSDATTETATSTATPTQPIADYLVTGCWSLGALDEAKKYIQPNCVASNAATNHTTVTSREEWQLTPAASYFHYCHNETVHGVEFRDCPQLELQQSNSTATAAVPIVCDMSSCFLSREFDITRYGLVYAGVQKNVGPAGVTIVIARRALLQQFTPHPQCPVMLNYTVQASKQSMYNTPPCFAIYMTGLVLKWLKEQTLAHVAQTNDKKAQLVYACIDESEGFYTGTVTQHEFRSRMNVNFKLRDEALLKPFLAQAEKASLIGLSGHRSVGGCRASIYNAVSLQSVEALIQHMKQFQQQHQQPKQ